MPGNKRGDKQVNKNAAKAKSTDSKKNEKKALKGRTNAEG
jgi:hypothetical protein